MNSASSRDTCSTVAHGYCAQSFMTFVVGVDSFFKSGFIIIIYLFLNVMLLVGGKIR